MPTHSVIVRPATQDEINVIVEIHQMAFPGFFLSALGPRFLRELYRGILFDESGILLVCYAQDRPVGFVAGTTQPVGFYSRLLRRKLVNFAAAAMLLLLRRPMFLPRIVRALRKPAEERRAVLNTALLMSLAVDPAVQRGGIGCRSR